MGLKETMRRRTEGASQWPNPLGSVTVQGGAVSSAGGEQMAQRTGDREARLPCTGSAAQEGSYEAYMGAGAQAPCQRVPGA